MVTAIASASECQRKDWKEHKKVCKSSASGKAAGDQRWVPVKIMPTDINNVTIPDTTILTIPNRNPKKFYTSNQESNAAATDAMKEAGKEFWVKVQVPVVPHSMSIVADGSAASTSGPCMVYNKERTVNGLLTKDNCACFDQIVSKIRKEGIMGIKGFFKARSKGNGVIDIDPTLISVKTW